MIKENISPKMKIELKISDINFILEALEDRPAKTNVMALTVEIKNQCEHQIADILN